MSMVKEASSRINALVLHRICEGPVELFEDVSLDVFKSLLDDTHDIEHLTIDAAYETNAPDNIVCLTFDDGYSSDWEIVFPSLVEHGVCATFFIVTDWIGRKGYLSRAQIREMNAAGMQIGSHSRSHSNFLDLEADVIISELTGSRQTLEDITGTEITTFSFPFGYETPALANSVFTSGYRYCCTSRHGIATRHTSIIPRNSINSAMSCLDVHNTVTASLSTRARWKVEDVGKSLLKKHFASLYPTIRAAITRK